MGTQSQLFPQSLLGVKAPQALLKAPQDLLKEHEGKGLHQAVEGLLRDTLGVAALQGQSPGVSTAASAPWDPPPWAGG